MIVLDEDQADRDRDPRVVARVAELELIRAAMNAAAAVRGSIVRLPPQLRDVMGALARAAVRYSYVMVAGIAEREAAEVRGKDAAAGGDRE